MDTIKTTLVRTDGVVDVQATLALLDTRLNELVETEESSLAEVGTAVHAVFDGHMGQTIPMPAVVAYSLTLVTFDGDFAAMDTRIKTFVRNSPEFLVKNGKGGGVVRVCDIPEPTEKTE